MVVTDQEKRPEQQIELKPIGNIATQQATNTPKEPLQLPSVEKLFWTIVYEFFYKKNLMSPYQYLKKKKKKKKRK